MIGIQFPKLVLGLGHVDLSMYPGKDLVAAVLRHCDRFHSLLFRQPTCDHGTDLILQLASVRGARYRPLALANLSQPRPSAPETSEATRIAMMEALIASG